MSVTKFVLLSIFILSFLIRALIVKDNLYFGFEQGRDAIQAIKIWQGIDYALVGPKTDIDGIFHGALYFYLLAPIYALIHNPVFVSYLFLIIHSLIPILIYKINFKLTGQNLISIGIAMLSAVSFEAVSNSIWLSNAVLAIPCSLLVLNYLIDYYQSGKISYFYLSIIFALLAIQFEIILLLELPLLFLGSLFIHHHHLNKKIIAAFSLAIITFIPLLLFNLRHQWMIITAIKKYPTNSSGTIFAGINGLTEIYSRIISRTIYLPYKLSLIIFTITILGLLFFWLKNYRQKNSSNIYFLTLLITFPLMSLPTLFFPSSVKLDQLHLNLGLGFILALGFGLGKLAKMINPASVKIIFTVLLILAGFNLYHGYPINDFHFMSSRGLIIKDQIAIINRIQSDSRGQVVRMVNYTRPYLQPEAWQYLADNNGIKRDDGMQTIYITIEPWVDKFWVDQWTKELGPTQVIFSEKYGQLTLEKRQKT